MILYRRYLNHWLILDSLISFRFLLFECCDLYYQWGLAKPASLGSAFTLHIDQLILFNAAYIVVLREINFNEGVIHATGPACHPDPKPVSTQR